MWNDNNKITAIIDEVGDKGQLFPRTCPICGNDSAHIYIHQHDDNHCGIWTWCGSCHSYSHMSGKTPTWWKNPDFVDGDQLYSEPEYLDEIADKIDEWVNSISPKEKSVSNDSFVMEDRFNVRLKEQLLDIPIGTTGVLIIKNDFKTMTIAFADEKGKVFSLNIPPEKVSSVFEVING